MVTAVGYLAPGTLLLAVLGAAALGRHIRDRLRAANQTITTALVSDQATGPLPVEQLPAPPGYRLWRVDPTGASGQLADPAAGWPAGRGGTG